MFDFLVRSIYPEAGVRAWEKFLELGRQIEQTSGNERTELLKEYVALGNAYNFEPHEIPTQN